mmetsp:Transcript_198/g.498  ORF Transcript_198/g.498 Transcript_198/m.498 type:complete len:264 (-) Transcript_198:185-976(-)
MQLVEAALVPVALKIPHRLFALASQSAPLERTGHVHECAAPIREARKFPGPPRWRAHWREARSERPEHGVVCMQHPAGEHDLDIRPRRRLAALQQGLRTDRWRQSIAPGRNLLPEMVNSAVPGTLLEELLDSIGVQHARVGDASHKGDTALLCSSYCLVRGFWTCVLHSCGRDLRGSCSHCCSGCRHWLLLLALVEPHVIAPARHLNRRARLHRLSLWAVIAAAQGADHAVEAAGKELVMGVEVCRRDEQLLLLEVAIAAALQ